MNELIERAARDLVDSRYAIALTGAGISTESGISDFRGPSGLWTMNPEAERAAYQTYPRFLKDPEEYWEERLAHPMLGDIKGVRPTIGHHALVELEKIGILKCLITQNIDDLHRKAGSRNLLEYHGNTFRLRCISCNSRYDEEEYDLRKLREEGRLPPHCRKCGGILKSDVVHFGEPIPQDIVDQSTGESLKCDLILICGTSAVVYPFASLPRMIRERGVAIIIEINAEPTALTDDGISDYLIQGRTGKILPELVEEVKKLKNQEI